MIPFGAVKNYVPNSERDKTRIHQNGKKVLSGFFLRICFDRGKIWKGDILMTHIEELEKLDASKTFPRRLNAKEVLITHGDRDYVLCVTDGSSKFSRRDFEFPDSILRREPTMSREHFNRKEFQFEEVIDDSRSSE